LAIIVLALHVFGALQQARNLDHLIHRWRAEYHLTEEQARLIRAMEEDFHGRGDPFLQPAHSMDETREHHRRIAKIMNPEDGERFLKANN